MNTLVLTNITHLSGTPYNVKVAGVVIKPAKSKKINISLLKDKDKKLLGSALKVGFESKKTLPDPLPMDIKEIKEYLNNLSSEQLEEINTAAGLTSPVSIKRLSRQIFRSEDLDPEVFYWTREWVLKDGDYVRP